MYDVNKMNDIDFWPLDLIWEFRIQNFIFNFINIILNVMYMKYITTWNMIILRVIRGSMCEHS